MREKLTAAIRWCSMLSIVGLCGCSNSTSAVSPKGFVWVATPADQKVTSYTIDWKTGGIAAVSSNAAVSTGMQPSAIAASNDGLTLFVANAGDDTIGVYTRKSDGSLSLLGPAVNAGKTPTAMVVDPTGNLLFVADSGSDTITVFSVTPGALTLKASFPIQTPAAPGGSGPVALALAPATFSCLDPRSAVPVTQTCYALYAANRTAGTVTAYIYFVDSASNFVRGSVDLNGNFVVGGMVSGSPYAVGSAPIALTFSRCAGVPSAGTKACAAPDKNSLFVANSGSGNVSVFSTCLQLGTCQNGESSPDGTLTSAGGPVPAGLSPSALLVNPVSDFVYVVDSGANQISEFQYSSTSGSLTALGTAQLSGSALLGAIAPNGGSAPSWMVLTGGSTLSTFGVAADGTLTAASAGQASVSGQPSAMLIR